MNPLPALCLLLTAQIVFVDAKLEAGPPGAIVIHEFKECDPVLNKVEFKPEMRNVDGVNTFALSFTLPVDYSDDNALVTFRADKWKDEAWEKDVYAFFDKELFSAGNSAIGRVWDKMRMEMEPQIDEPMEIKAGSYKIENFQAMSTDINAPNVPYGKLRITGVVSVNGEKVLCHQLILDSLEPKLI